MQVTVFWVKNIYLYNNIVKWKSCNLKTNQDYYATDWKKYKVKDEKEKRKE